MKPHRAWCSHPAPPSEASSTLAIDEEQQRGGWGDKDVLREACPLVFARNSGYIPFLIYKTRGLGQLKALTFYYLPIRNLCLLVPNEMSFQVGLER